MREITIKLDEAVIKGLERLLEFKSENSHIQTKEQIIELFLLEDVPKTLMQSDDNFIGSDLEKELKEAYVNFYPPSSKDRKFIENINKIETLQRKLNNSKTKEEKREVIKEMRDFVTNMEVSDEEDRKVKQDMLSFVEFIESTTEEIHNEK